MPVEHGRAETISIGPNPFNAIKAALITYARSFRRPKCRQGNPREHRQPRRDLLQGRQLGR